jgi:hypothetical protein
MTSAAAPTRGFNPQEQAALTDLFSYHAPSPDQILRMDAIRAAGERMAAEILMQCPRSADRSAAIRQVREACFTANASIALEGRNLP